MIILDTNVVSETMRPAPDSKVITWLAAQPVPQLFITVITVAELQAGVEKLHLGRRRDDIQSHVMEVLAAFSGATLPFDSDAAHYYGQLVGPIMRTKARIEPLDYQIAAIARLHKAAVATRNVKHFEGTGVDIIDPWSS